MKKLFGKIITCFFIFVFATLWFLTARYYASPTKFSIVVSKNDMHEKISDLRTEFKTQEVAHSFLTEYQKEFPNYDFSIEPCVPEFKRRVLKNMFWNLHK